MGSTEATAHYLAVDVGGTFIDFVLLDQQTGELVVEKQPSTAASLVEEFLDGMSRLPVGADAVGRLFHGTTVAINAVVQGRGASVGLLTTAGFRDVLGIGRGARPQLYNFHYLPASPLVPRYMRREVPERIAADGSELIPLDLDALDRETDHLVERGAEAIAICFLHAFTNPVHEQQAVERIRQRHPDLPVTGSAEVAAEWREFERSSTVTLNAYVQPLFGAYVGSLQQRLREAGYTRPLAIMQSNGGVISADRAGAHPIRTLQSGPAGGVIGARFLAEELGHEHVICADVGGTTYDVALIEGGEILERTETDMAGRPIVGPVIDIISIGAGGGSIAAVDPSGALRVGPESAGASPGPSAFGLGGEDPTVTDAHVLLGWLDPDNFLGARMQLDVDAARKTVETRIARPLGLSIEEAASGILAIAETNMTYAIRRVTVERGLDPREFVMCSYGGGGGLFAARVAEVLQVSTVIVPQAPANFSAWGMLNADYLADRALTAVRPLSANTMTEVIADFGTLQKDVQSELESYGFAGDRTAYVHRLDMRYVGQAHTITITVSEPGGTSGESLLDEARTTFAATHQQMYGHGTIDAPLEVVTARVRGVGEVQRPKWPPWGRSSPGDPVGQRQVHFPDGGYQATTIYRRDELGVEQRIAGPAIIEEWTTTIVVPPGWTATVDALGNLILSMKGR